MKTLITLLFILVQTITYSQVKTYNYIAIVSPQSTLDNVILDNVQEDRTTFYLTDSIVYYSSRVNSPTEVVSQSIYSTVIKNNRSFRYYETEGLTVLYDEERDCIYFFFLDGESYIFFN
jgi:hypothetical protein